MICFNLLPEFKKRLIGAQRSDICYGCDVCRIPVNEQCPGFVGFCGNRIVSEWGFCIECVNAAPNYFGPRFDWIYPFP